MNPSTYRRYRGTHRDLVAHPVRMVHLGVGAFHRSHQAWYTHRANIGSSSGWGIAAFTGRTPAVAETLATQDGLYHLITRDAETETVEVVGSLSEVHDGSDAGAWRAAVAAPETRVLTLTITEKGYRLAGRAPDIHGAELSADIALLRAWTPDGVLPTTSPGRIVDGLLARRAAGSGPIAVVSCDNLPANGDLTRAVVRAVAAAVDPDLAVWIDSDVSFPSTVVDRITPAMTTPPMPFAANALDVAGIVTEPHSEWVIVDDFPGGRPDWDRVGAQFVTDVRPYEERKLWMLNGAHTLLATVSGGRGIETVAAAIADPASAELVEQLWDDAVALIDLPADELAAYRTSLKTRFANSRIEHRLTQIALDTATKIGLRIVPVLEGTRAAGRGISVAAVEVVSAWMLAQQAESDVATVLADLEAHAAAADPEIVEAIRMRLDGMRADASQELESRGTRR